MNEFAEVTWVAVGVGTIAAFIFGMAWYHPKLLGTKWAEGSGVDMQAINKVPVFPMVTQLLALLFLALVIGMTAPHDMLFTAVFGILACATFVASSGSFGPKTMPAVMIDFGYVFLAGVIMIVCQGIF